MSFFNLGYNIICENNIDKTLLLFEKPLDKLLNRDIMLYHGSNYDIKEKMLSPIVLNVGATIYSDPRWSTFFWDNRESAINWALFRTMGTKEFGFKAFFGDQYNSMQLTSRDGSYIDMNTIIKVLKKHKPYIFVYSAKVPANKIEIGSTKMIREYTVSEPVEIYKKEKILVTPQLIEKHFKIVQREEFDKVIQFFTDNYKLYKGARKSKILNMLLDDDRDNYKKTVKRKISKANIKSGNLNAGDDLTQLKKEIKHAIKHDTLGLKK